MCVCVGVCVCVCVCVSGQFYAMEFRMAVDSYMNMPGAGC